LQLNTLNPFYMAAFHPFIERKLFIPECSKINTRAENMTQNKTQILNQIQVEKPVEKTQVIEVEAVFTPTRTGVRGRD